MAPNSKHLHAVVVLPPGLHGNVRRPGQRRWLAGGRMTQLGRRETIFEGVLRVLGLPVPEVGLAALRLWGQTGVRPEGWVAAADPVHLEARLDHLCLHVLPESAVSPVEIEALFGQLQTALGSAGQMEFSSLGRCGYLRGAAGFATTVVAPQAVDGRRPDDFLPDGVGSDAHDRLLGEVQMLLHEHEINQMRAADGRLAINSLWFWGGGTVPESGARPLPALYAEDPLLRGYWQSCDASVAKFAGRFAACRQAAEGDFVAVVPDCLAESRPAALDGHLDELRKLLHSREVDKLTLLFRDGLAVELHRRDRLRIWRSIPDFLQEAKDDG